MKKLLFLLCSLSSIVCQEASKGAVVEAHFIIKNREKELTEYIQEIKKELTQSLVPSDEERRFIDNYHAGLKKILFPSYLKELEQLVVLLQKQQEPLISNSVTEEALASVVDFSERIIDKCRADKAYMADLFILDTQLYDIERLIEKARVARRKVHTVPTLKEIDSKKWKSRLLEYSQQLQLKKNELSVQKKKVAIVQKELAQLYKALQDHALCSEIKIELARLTPIN